MRNLTLFLYLLAGVTFSHAEEAVVNVTVKTVSEVAYYPRGSAPATVLSLNDATLSAQIASEIISIPVKVSDIVTRGDVLVELDCRNAIALRKSSQSKLALAEFQLQRVKKLRKSNHVSDEELRNRQSELQVARSAYEVSAVDVERCQVTAPYRGVVTQRKAAIGEWVSQGTPLLQFVDLENIELSAQVAELSSSTLHNVTSFEFVTGEMRYPLKLRAISQVVDKISRTREVRLQFVEKQPGPGQSGRLVWQDTRLHLPADYLVRRDAVYGVFVIRDGQAIFVNVPNAQEGRPVKIDLAHDVQLIDKGRYSVNDHGEVNIIRKE